LTPSPLIATLFHSMRKSFTLIELLVVVAIIALLMGLLVPALGQARRESWKTVCGANLKNIGLAFDMYRGEYQDVYPCANDPVNIPKNWWLWMGRGFRPVLEPYIAPELSAKNPNILWCPQDRSPMDRYENTSYSYTMSFYHSPSQINQMTNKSFTYSTPQAGVGISSGRVAWPTRKILAGEWFSNHKPVTGDSGWWNWQGARTFLFADGHSEYLPATRIKAANDTLPDPNLTVDGVEGSDI
jgi:prepilin-type N-terminal cleavage/methylation domain-containing protein/prepilin-type processing-associated H-X9-DG protein